MACGAVFQMPMNSAHWELRENAMGREERMQIDYSMFGAHRAVHPADIGVRDAIS